MMFEPRQKTSLNKALQAQFGDMWGIELGMDFPAGEFSLAPSFFDANTSASAIWMVGSTAGTVLRLSPERRGNTLATVRPVDRASVDVALPPSMQRPGRNTKANQRLIMNGYLEPAKMFLRPRSNREAPIEVFSRFMYTLANFEANLVRANLRGFRPHQCACRR